MSDAIPHATVHLLDLRDLPPPQPMERILARLDRLQPGERLLALTPFYPAPLLPLLAQSGFAYDAQAAGDGARLVICHDTDRHLLGAPLPP